MPENASTKGGFLNAATGNHNSGGNRSSYQDKDKPTQIRFSHISAGKESFRVPAYGEALEINPSTLAENVGLNPTVTELRNRHAQGERTAGVHVRKVST
ncbi:hypothetical protein E2320_019926 [Naja naja]|nr:hypothetical protein E2320_019926 [Naja naja]